MNPGELAWMAWTQTWQLAALIAAIGVVVRIAAKRRPHLAHVLWLVVLAKCLTPPLMKSPGGIFCWLQPQRAVETPLQNLTTAKSRIVGLSTASDFATDAALEFGAGPLGRPAPIPVETEEIVADARSVMRADSTAPNRTSDHSPSESLIPASDHEHRPLTRAEAFARLSKIALPWLGGLWLAGSAGFLAIALFRWRSCLHCVRHCHVEFRPDLDALVADLSQRLKLRRPVRLLVTTSRFGPAVIGLWRPTILLPAVVVECKSARDLEPIVAHELIHVRRGDLWIGMWQVVTQAMWWFHPLVRVANRLATRAAEACCDEEVIAELNFDPDRYARSLLDVVALQRGLLSVPTFPGMRPVDVTRERLERIVSLGQGRLPRTPVWCWLVMLLAAVATLPGAAFVVSANDEDNLQAADHKSSVKAVPEPATADGIPKPPLPAPPDNRRQAEVYLSDHNWASDSKYQFRTKTAYLYFQEFEKVEPTGKVRFQPFAMIWRPEGHPADKAPYTILSDSVLVEFASNFDIMNAHPARIIGAALEGIVKIGGPDNLSLKGQNFHFAAKALRVWSDDAVSFRQGRQTGRAPGVEVDLIPNSASESGEIPAVSGVRTVRVRKDATTEFVLETADRELTQANPPVTEATQKREESSGNEGNQTLQKADDSAEPKDFAKVMWKLHSDVAMQKCDQALLANADEIIGSIPVHSLNPELGRRTELRGDVKLWLQDSSMEVVADRAVVTARRLKAPEQSFELTIRLSGNVRWASGELKAFAQDLSVRIRPAFPDDTSTPRLSELILTGGARFSGKDFAGTADAIQVRFEPEKDLPEKRSMRLTLRSDATLSQADGPAGGNRELRGQRIVFLPHRSELWVEGVVRTPDDEGARPGLSEANPGRSKAADFPANKDEMVTMNYSVADLVVPIPIGREQRAMPENGAAATAVDGQSATKATGIPTHDPKVLAQFDGLMNLIGTTVAPDTWDSHSGSGSMMPYRTTLSLVIRQKGSVHEEIADLLRQLRRLQDLQVVLQLDVLTVTDASLKTIPVDLDSVQGDKVSHLSEIQVGRIREFAEKSHGAAFTNCAKVTFFNGQVAELTLRRQMLKSANRTVPLPPLHFVPMISADQSSVRLKIAIGATQPLEALARSREYVITLGQSLLADITNDLDSYQIPGLPGIVAETLLRERKKPPAERVLMFITPRVIVQEEEELINVKPR